MNLEEVHRGIKRARKRRRVGRGTGSGRGKTAGRGHKGQQSRAGWSVKPTFQGGAMPLVRRVPKRGFHNRFAPVVVNVNVGQLQQAFEDGQQVDAQSLRAKGLARSRWDVLKILGDGQLSKKLTVHAHRFSQSAREKIEQAGGQAVTVPTKVPVAEKQQAKGRESAGKSS